MNFETMTDGMSLNDLVSTTDELPDTDFVSRLRIAHDDREDDTFFGVSREALERWLTDTPREKMLTQLARVVLWDVMSFDALNYADEFEDFFGTKEQVQTLLEKEAGEGAEVNRIVARLVEAANRPGVTDVISDASGKIIDVRLEREV